VSNQLVDVLDLEIAAPPSRGSFWGAVRGCVEFVLLFAGAFAVKHVLLAEAGGEFPSPYWFPVLMLSLQYGMSVGLLAAAAGVGLEFWNGFPQAFVTEDVYAYVGRIGAQPAAWTCAALLLGHTRTREIERTRELEEKLAEEARHSAAVGKLCADLRARASMLERRLAAAEDASVADVAEAITKLYEAHWESISERVARLIVVLLGTAEFSVYLLRGERLTCLLPVDPHSRQPLRLTVEAESPLFSAVVRERKTLSAARVQDRALLTDRNLLIGPLTDQGPSGHVIGMLVIGGADLSDFPDDVERRLALTCAQLSRLFSRVILLDHAQIEPRHLIGADEMTALATQGGAVQ
jgi:hypothetical protein